MYIAFYQYVHCDSKTTLNTYPVIYDVYSKYTGVVLNVRKFCFNLKALFAVLR